jgi:hypothetical protein
MRAVAKAAIEGSDWVGVALTAALLALILGVLAWVELVVWRAVVRAVRARDPWQPFMPDALGQYQFANGRWSSLRATERRGGLALTWRWVFTALVVATDWAVLGVLGWFFWRWVLPNL